MAAASCLPVDCCWPVIGRMKPILTPLSCAPAPPAATRTAAQAAARKSFCRMEPLPFIARFPLGGIPTFRPGLVQFPDVSDSGVGAPDPAANSRNCAKLQQKAGRFGRSDGQDRARAWNVAHADAARFRRDAVAL